MKSRFVLFQLWLVALLICAGAVTLSFLYVDVPLAHFFSKPSPSISPSLNQAAKEFGSTAILTVEALTVLSLVLIRLMREQGLPLLAEAMGLACATSICVYGIDAGVLKPFFGVPNPSQFLHGMPHAFHFWDGSTHSGFPSGHMMLAAPVAGVFMRLYRKSLWPLSVLLVIGCALLVVGEWHFLSDVIAGTFLGLSAGLLAAELWLTLSN